MSRLWEAVQAAWEVPQPSQEAWGAGGHLVVEVAAPLPNCQAEGAGEAAILPPDRAREEVGAVWGLSPTLPAGEGAYPSAASAGVEAWGETVPGALGASGACQAGAGACDGGGASPGAWVACLEVPAEAVAAWPWGEGAEARPRSPCLLPWGARGARRRTAGGAGQPGTGGSARPTASLLPSRAARPWRPF